MTVSASKNIRFKYSVKYIVKYIYLYFILMRYNSSEKKTILFIMIVGCVGRTIHGVECTEKVLIQIPKSPLKEPFWIPRFILDKVNRPDQTLKSLTTS